MGRITGAVHVITTVGRNGDAALTATAVCSVTAEPPTVLVCVNTNCFAHNVIQESGVFAINTLSDEDRDLADIFAGKGGLSFQDRFSNGTWVRGVTGAPILQSSVVSVECEVSETSVVGSHTVFFGRIVGAFFTGQHDYALVYGSRRYGSHDLTDISVSR